MTVGHNAQPGIATKHLSLRSQRIVKCLLVTPYHTRKCDSLQGVHASALDMRAKGFAASTSCDPIPALATLPSKNFCERIAA
jgi:hypothetical protein